MDHILFCLRGVCCVLPPCQSSKITKMEPAVVSSGVSATSSVNSQSSSIVVNRVAEFEERILQEQRAADTLAGRRLDELSVRTQGTTATSSDLSTRTKVNNLTAEENFEVHITQEEMRSNKIASERDQELLGTHVSFADGEESASCATDSVHDEGEEKLMAAIAAATNRNAKGNGQTFSEPAETPRLRGSKALQEVERVLFFTDVVDRNPVKHPQSAPQTQITSSNSDSVDLTLALSGSVHLANNIFSPLLKKSSATMKDIGSTVAKASAEAFHEVEKACKEVERTLLFTDLPEGPPLCKNIENQENEEEAMDPKAIFAQALKNLEKTFLFTDLQDDAIQQCKSMPATPTTDIAAIDSTLSMCQEMQRTLCFTDLEPNPGRKSSLVSQVILSDERETPLVTASDLQRFQDRIAEVRKLHLSNKNRNAYTVEATKELQAEDTEEEKSAASGFDYSSSNASGDDFRLLAEVLVGSSNKSAEEADLPSASSNIKDEQRNDKQFYLGKEVLNEEKQDGQSSTEEEVTEELTETLTEESHDKNGGAGELNVALTEMKMLESVAGSDLEREQTAQKNATEH